MRRYAVLCWAHDTYTHTTHVQLYREQGCTTSPSPSSCALRSYEASLGSNYTHTDSHSPTCSDAILARARRSAHATHDADAYGAAYRSADAGPAYYRSMRQAQKSATTTDSLTHYSQAHCAWHCVIHTVSIGNVSVCVALCLSSPLLSPHSELLGNVRARECTATARHNRRSPLRDTQRAPPR